MSTVANSVLQESALSQKVYYISRTLLCYKIFLVNKLTILYRSEIEHAFYSGKSTLSTTSYVQIYHEQKEDHH